MYYECLGNFQYRITLKVYRDCYLGQAPYDDPASITIWNGDGSLYQNILISSPIITSIPFDHNPCFTAPANVCVQEGIYQTTISLPANNTGYILAYQRCCRNNTIVNIISPQTTGATYTESVPPQGSVVCNNSPRFNNFPPIAVCIGDTLKFDHSAFDPDGDSLVYELCATHAGADPSAPMPSPTSPPPFPFIAFASPYSAGYPVASSPPISINPQTGALKLFPTQLGQYVVGVCAREYRNGVQIGTHRRDFQFNVTNCPTNVLADFQVTTSHTVAPDGSVIICGSRNVSFGNLSSNSSAFYWNFGDPFSSSDFSMTTNPSYLYPDTGVYVVSLIANPGYFCADTAWLTIRIRPELVADFVVPEGQCIDGNSFDFLATGVFGDQATIAWDFSPSATPSASNLQNPTGISFSIPGIHPVVLTITENECQDQAMGSVIVYGHPSADFTAPSPGCDPYTVKYVTDVDLAYNSLVFSWNLGNGQYSDLQDPTTTYSAGLYDVSLVVVSITGCKDTIVIDRPGYMLVNPSPTAAFMVEPLERSIFYPYFTIRDLSSGAIDCWMLFGNSDIQNSCNLTYLYSDTGHYPLTQVVINEFGCRDTAVIEVVVSPEFTFFIPNTFTVNEDGLNETFRGFGIGIESYEMRIFDRWGQVLMYTTDQQEGWNGRKNNIGGMVPAGMYLCSFLIKDVFGQSHIFNGTVLLLRKSTDNLD
jgi:gliding motility-associated-like protein